jgi:hypothetical protein
MIFQPQQIESLEKLSTNQDDVEERDDEAPRRQRGEREREDSLLGHCTAFGPS